MTIPCMTSLRSMAVLVGRAEKKIKAGEDRETARLGDWGGSNFLFFSRLRLRLRRSCARLDKTAMLRRLMHKQPNTCALFPSVRNANENVKKAKGSIGKTTPH